MDTQARLGVVFRIMCCEQKTCLLSPVSEAQVKPERRAKRKEQNTRAREKEGEKEEFFFFFFFKHKRKKKKKKKRGKNNNLVTALNTDAPKTEVMKTEPQNCGGGGGGGGGGGAMRVR